MNKKHNHVLLQIINEEIEHFLLEQDPNAMPPADPNASPTPPTDPNTAGATPPEEEKKDEGNDVKKKIDGLSKQSDEDIRKTILAKLQNGAEKKDVEEILRYIEDNKNETDPEKSVPRNLKKVVFQLQKDFEIKTPPPKPEKPEEKPSPATPSATPTPPATPVTESRLQKLAKEYLLYKKLYLRSQ